MKRIFLVSILILVFLSCNNKGNIIIEFTPINNFGNKETIVLDMDLDEVVNNGIVIPSINQSEDGYFHIRAEVKPRDEGDYYYKIYYQNESYKYEEDNEFANENFYGSWEDNNIEFKPLAKSGLIEDSFRILGNPRNERMYFGTLATSSVKQEDILKGIEGIRNDKKWLEAIKEKAKKNKISLEKQLYLDMSWILKNNNAEGDINNRWKRNPRTGEYSFILVVVDNQGLNSLPRGVRNIGIKDSIKGYINPYTYFKYAKGKNSKGVYYKISSQKLRLKAVLSPKNGVFIDILKYPDNNFRIFPNQGRVGNNDTLFNKALFEQFFHTISKSYNLENIPIIEDLNNYSKDDYQKNSKKYSNKQSRIIDYPYITDYPGKTVSVDKNGEFISLINPGNKENTLNPKKQSVGVITRLGFTYGKFRGKIKFPHQLNKHGVWSGLTNAFWLIYQSDSEWNSRRICKDKGYVKPGLEIGEDAGRTPISNYSEIDIEIIKTSKYWPGENNQDKNYDPFNNEECILACTNWDLACPNPKNFFKSGINKIKYQDNDFSLHRWSESYRALTIRKPIMNNIFDKDYYYFEIEWKPNEIIWRLGESPENMYIIGYINDKYSYIPNNQMLTVITQEYHYSEYWPPILYDQNLIPYPKNDIQGRVYDISVE